MITREDCIKVGTITKSHNLKGEVVIVTDNDFLENYADEPVFLLLEGAPVPFFIAQDGLSVRNSRSYIVKFDFVDSPEQAERLVGADVLLAKTSLEEEDGNTPFDFDVFDLKGFRVEDEASGQNGIITDVADYSGNVVFSIDIFGKEILLPLSENYIKEISFENKMLVTFIPQDIIDLY